MSYNEKAVEEFGQAYVVEKFCEIVKGNFREKLTRVAVALLVNVVTKQNGEHCQIMTESDLLETLFTLMEKHWSDPDVMADMEQLEGSNPEELQGTIINRSLQEGGSKR